VIVVNPESYKEVLSALRKEGALSADMRRRLAAEAFAHTAEYDRLITEYLKSQL
jgi:phosphoribosylaminoimidazolecarboxamide formyltransferase/IMP cyclohydrolase